ncbi:type I restriction enzyme, S subunit [Selenomonas ruminantium]|uniref:Type I restriction enzyme, S subunit n=1 Tax=Selenomonas ruminantium TaxID=971 RepID=A0A1I3FJG6_SELRU|nr:restriction endonuclease subunit S [Selenomonas ruminantium]SFI11375.1 type I restriction enzyme, S subunit [Selenomonas ruminantium]
MKAVMRDEREMKDSGIDWIGKIPNCWRTSRLKDISEIQTGSTPDKKFQAEYYSRENGVPWIKAENLGMPNPICTTKEYLTKNGCDVGRVFPANTVYVCCIASIGKVGYSTIPCSCNQQINGILFDNKYIDYKFGYYLSIAQEEEYILRASGNVLKILNTQQQSYIPCVIPLLNEQQLIAHYLDDRCFKIDAIIAEAKASIEEYKELKQAVIYEAVTKGLDKNVEMKTYNDWFDMCPANWKYEQIRYLYELRDERNFDPLSEVNLISLYTDRGVMQHSDIEKTSGNKAVTADGYKKVYPEDIVVNIILCWMGAMGRSEYQGVTSPAYDVYKPIEESVICSRYYHYLFRTERFSKKCYTVGRGIMMMRWRTYSSQFKAIKVPVPMYKEQVEIANYLDTRTKQIDNLVEEKQSLIADLESYKKSLIYEVVTGKRKVVA